MALRVLYVSPLALDGNPAIDAIAYGLQHILHAAGIELCVLCTDFTAPDYRRQYEDAIAAGIAARVDAIVIYVITPSAFGEPVAKARAAGIPVFTFVRPRSSSIRGTSVRHRSSASSAASKASAAPFRASAAR